MTKHGLWRGLVLLFLFARPAAALYEPPLYIEKKESAPTGLEAPQDLAKRILPAASQLLFKPFVCDFGVYQDGVALIFQPDPPGDYAIWYITAVPGEDNLRLIRIRDPQLPGEFSHIAIHAAFSTGPEQAKDLVVLEQLQQSADGQTNATGSIYRQTGQQAVMRLDSISQHLTGISDEKTARHKLKNQKLKNWIPTIPAVKHPALARYFMHLPVQYCDLTRLERWERIKPDSQYIKVNDPANGFLHILGDGGLPGYILTQFSRKNNTPLIAVQTVYTTGQVTHFLVQQQNQWIDISEKIVPDYQDSLNYRLPRHGTTMQVYHADSNQLLYTLSWNQQQFTKK